MTKIEISDISCIFLQLAYNRAIEKGRSGLKPPPQGSIWPRAYLDHVTTSGSSVGIDACRKCGKQISVTSNYVKVEGSVDGAGNPNILYDYLDGGQSIEVAGKCTEDKWQR